MLGNCHVGSGGKMSTKWSELIWKSLECFHVLSLNADFETVDSDIHLYVSRDIEAFQTFVYKKLCNWIWFENHWKIAQITQKVWESLVKRYLMFYHLFFRRFSTQPTEQSFAGNLVEAEAKAEVEA